MPERELQNEKDVDEILKLVIRNSDIESDHSLRDRLNRSAAELGFTPEQVAQAEELYFDHVKEKTLEKEYLKEQQRSFVVVLGIFAVFTLLFGIGSWIMDGTLYWPVIPVLLWCFIALTSMIPAMTPRSRAFKNEFERWKKKRGNPDA